MVVCARTAEQTTEVYSLNQLSQEISRTLYGRVRSGLVDGNAWAVGMLLYQAWQVCTPGYGALQMACSRGTHVIGPENTALQGFHVQRTNIRRQTQCSGPYSLVGTLKQYVLMNYIGVPRLLPLQCYYIVIVGVMYSVHSNRFLAIPRWQTCFTMDTTYDIYGEAQLQSRASL